MINNLKKRIKGLDEHTHEVMMKSSSSIIIKVIGVFAKIFISIFIARILGKEGLGEISLINQLVAICLIFSMLGMDNVIIKQVSIGFESKNLTLIGSTIKTSLLINGSLTTIISITGIILSGYISQYIFQIPDLRDPLIITFSVLLLEALSRVFTSSINGYRKVWQSNLFKEVLTLVVTALSLLIYWILDENITVVDVVICYVIGKLVTFLSSLIYLRKLFGLKQRVKLIIKPMFKTGLPLFFVAATSTVAASTDIIMLGMLSNSAEVGLYTVASRLALLVVFFLQISNSSISPKLANLFAENRIDEMNIMTKRVTLGLLLVGLSFVIFLALFGKYILGIWGQEFTGAYSILVILGVGQLFNISTGCSGLLLIMCGFEKTHGYISGFFLILNLLLNYLMIRSYGALGAAVATSVVVILENISKMYLAKLKTGVSTLPI